MALAAGWMVFRTELRRRWRAWLALALIVGAFAGVVEAAAAGARRTDAAYPSLQAWSDAPDVLLFSFAGTSRTFGRFPVRAAANLPQAGKSAILASYTVATPAAVEVIAPETSAVPSRFWHRRILSGRLPDPARPGEVDISFTLAQAAHLGTGDILRVRLVTSAGRTVPVSFRIVGVDAAPAEFPPQTGTGSETVWATPAFYRAHESGLDMSPAVALRLRHGAADLPAVQRELSRLAGGKFVQTYPLASQAVNTQRSIHLQAVALWLVAAVLAVIGLLVLGQLLARMSFLDSVEYRTLLALGISRHTLLAIGLLRAAIIGVAGAAAGALAALALSPALPVGLARVAEPYPGVHADGPVFGLGVVAAVLVTVAATAWPTWRAASTAPAAPAPAAAGAGRRKRLFSARLTAGIRSVTAMLGIRLALQPGAGRTAVPVRSTVASAVVGVAALTGALVFSASLGHLLATPRLYGVTWDAFVSNTQQRGIGAAASSLAGQPGVTAWSAGYSGFPLSIRGVRADGIAMLPGHHAALLPVALQGHLPRGPGEIAVGERTLAAIHAHVGQTIKVSLGGFRPGPLRIVGTAVFPTISDVLGLGKGATLTVAGAAPAAAAWAARPAPGHPARPVPPWFQRPVRAERVRGPCSPAGPVRGPGTRDAHGPGQFRPGPGPSPAARDGAEPAGPGHDRAPAAHVGAAAAPGLRGAPLDRPDPAPGPLRDQLAGRHAHRGRAGAGDPARHPVRPGGLAAVRRPARHPARRGAAVHPGAGGAGRPRCWPWPSRPCPGSRRPGPGRPKSCAVSSSPVPGRAVSRPRVCLLPPATWMPAHWR